ncbi:hypothetical protein K474DRAFT_1685720 [Panus rudis PR-1116 ss-1]|nr:hypothetical protein K474DRAFT_1685720 [Panus rudis PR-1116 ss-1]
MEPPLPHVANILVKMRRHSRRSSPISTPPLTPPRSAKAHHIESSSGPEPQTHPSLRGDNAGVSVRKVPLIQEARYVCADAVDVVKLVRAVRAELYEKAEAIGANVLVDEQWTCTICGPRHRRDGTFKVFVRYSASAARASVPDPQRPVALENAKGVPGLMTVISRDE